MCSRTLGLYVERDGQHLVVPFILLIPTTSSHRGMHQRADRHQHKSIYITDGRVERHIDTTTPLFSVLSVCALRSTRPICLGQGTERRFG